MRCIDEEDGRDASYDVPSLRGEAERAGAVRGAIALTLLSGLGGVMGGMLTREALVGSCRSLAESVGGVAKSRLLLTLHEHRPC